MSAGVSHKVVVIDDERPILMTLEALLKRHGYAALLANTAAAGIAAVRKNSPDLVLLDLGLPDADGLDVLKELRRDWPDTQVIILTAHDSLSNAIDSIKLGAFHFISKPYAPEELLSLMGQALEKRQLSQEAARLRQRERELSK
jgi:DNA-binding NtrC family response regulator